MDSSANHVLKFRMSSPMNALRLMVSCVVLTGAGVSVVHALSQGDRNSAGFWTFVFVASGAVLWTSLQARLKCRHQLDQQALRLRSYRTSFDVSVPVIGGVGMAMSEVKSPIGLNYSYWFPCVWDRNGVTYAMRGITVMQGNKQIERLLSSRPGVVARMLHEQIREWQGPHGWLASHHVHPGTTGIRALIALRPSPTRGVDAYQVWDADEGWSEEVTARPA